MQNSKLTHRSSQGSEENQSRPPKPALLDSMGRKVGDPKVVSTPFTRKPSPSLDLSGMKFGRLLVLNRTGERQRYNYIYRCKCDCGKMVRVIGSSLRYNRTKSCGCAKRDATASRNKAGAIHGMSRNPVKRRVYNSWCGMMTRCFNKKQSAYKHYGGRGITACEFLKTSPENLISLIGLRPENTTLDRVNTHAGYTCGNCSDCKAHGWSFNVRWATAKEQNRNSTQNRLITVDGKTLCVAAWAEELGVPKWAITNRLHLPTRRRRSDEEVIRLLKNEAI